MAGFGRWFLAGASVCSSYPVYALVTDWGGGTVRKVDLETASVLTVMSGLSRPAGVAVSPVGDFALVTESLSHRVLKLNLASMSSTVLAGGVSSGAADGVGTAARFNWPLDVKISRDQSTAFVCDQENHAIRKINLLDNSVVRIAGTLSPGYAEGQGTSILMIKPAGMDISEDGSFVVYSEYDGHRVRKLMLNGDFTTSSLVAGSTAGASGFQDGTGSAVRFANPQQLIISSDMTFVLVVDRGNNKLRKVVLSTGVVTTMTTFSGVLPIGIGWAALEDFALVTGYDADRILKVAVPSGVTTSFAGIGLSGESDNAVGLLAQFYQPHGLGIWKCSIQGYGIFSSSSVCELCLAGKYGPGSGMCVPCPTGTFSTALGLKGESAGECWLIRCSSVQSMRVRNFEKRVYYQKQKLLRDKGT
jgi:DNA-binding beta-propeller fold protein YncE